MTPKNLKPRLKIFIPDDVEDMITDTQRAFHEKTKSKAILVLIRYGYGKMFKS